MDLEFAELDGVGRFIAALARKYHKSLRQCYEDCYQDAVLIYLKHRDKYDPTRGKRTTFVAWLLYSKLLKSGLEKNRKTVDTGSSVNGLGFDWVAASVAESPEYSDNSLAADIVKWMDNYATTKKITHIQKTTFLKDFHAAWGSDTPSLAVSRAILYYENRSKRKMDRKAIVGACTKGILVSQPWQEMAAG